MAQYSYTEKYLEKDKKPFFPMMGEFHFSRYPEEFWEEEICKMKAGGIDIVSTYVIWIHHEEEEGVFDFSGQRNLRRFLELCKKWNMKVFLRIGPWSHGEVRNGGFPDWLVKKGYERFHLCRDEIYFSSVRRYWTKVYEQAQGYFLDEIRTGGNPGQEDTAGEDRKATSGDSVMQSERGCIIGIQIENECGHVGGPGGEEGNEYIRRLTAMAKEIGYRAPYWTATGWGGAVIGDLLPVMGGYCDAPWDHALEKLPPSRNYLITDVRNDGNFLLDYNVPLALTFDKEKYPYLHAELGGGTQVSHRRRPWLKPEDTAAMAFSKLAGGSNMLGFYMYHGGTNPVGKLSTLQESVESGSFYDVPELSYDFQAPIREYGQISETCRELKLFSMFFHAFGSDFCKMTAQFSEEQKKFDIDDMAHFQMSVRRKGRQGYLFVSNYQRNYEKACHPLVNLTVELEDETIRYPEQSVENGDFFFYPFHFSMKNLELLWINGTPLCQLDSKIWFFYGRCPLQYEITGSPEKTKSEKIIAKAHQTIVLLTKEAAKNVWSLSGDRHAIYISENPVLETEKGTAAIVRSDSALDDIYRISTEKAKDWENVEMVPDFMQVSGDRSQLCIQRKVLKKPENSIVCGWRMLRHGDQYDTYMVKMDYKKSFDKSMEDVFLQFDYEADMAELYLGEEKIADAYYIGEKWEVGLKRFEFPKELVLRIYPIRETDEVYLEKEIPFTDGVCCRINEIDVVTEQICMIPTKSGQPFLIDELKV